MTPSSTPTLRHERALLRDGYRWLAGIDEVGRGALAGPVTVGVVLVDLSVRTAPRGLRDSKLLNPELRQVLAPKIRRWAPHHAVGHASPDEIDTWGILRALRVAGERALAQLAVAPDVVLLDGSYDWLTKPRAGEPTLFDDEDAWQPPAYRVRTMIKADLRCAAVAAASVLAKTERDAWMVELARQHPGYGWEANKGYATPDHWAALDLHGPCRLHRRSWRPFRPDEARRPALDTGMPGQNGLTLDDLEELLA
jgi:ribonuclease HII